MRPTGLPATATSKNTTGFIGNAPIDLTVFVTAVPVPKGYLILQV